MYHTTGKDLQCAIVFPTCSCMKTINDLGKGRGSQQKGIVVIAAARKRYYSSFTPCTWGAQSVGSGNSTKWNAQALQF